MSLEQFARDFVTSMNDPKKVEPLVTQDAMASGGVLPQPMPARAVLDQFLSGLVTALPDLKFDIQQVTVNGNQATVQALWSGTQSGTLRLPGIPAIPPTGKKVSAKDAYVLTVLGDKVTHFHIESPADGGIPAALAQPGADGKAG